MRLNKYIASGTSLSRRAADGAIERGRVTVNSVTATLGTVVNDGDTVLLDGRPVQVAPTHTTILFHKPRGYVCSRDGQGSATIYELLPKQYQKLQPAGRLDKNSSGLLLLSSDGDVLQQLTHPKYQKNKVYRVKLNAPLEPLHQQMITNHGVALDDGPSRFSIQTADNNKALLNVTLSEGRNRQIRRTFDALGYRVTDLHRTQFGPYNLGEIPEGAIRTVAF
jgi:23S rRNA pseudouridine2605 synthase